MRSVWRAYVMQRSTVPGTTYLFIIPSFTDNPGMAGYMPLKSNYGFLTPQATTRDAAHELSHVPEAMQGASPWRSSCI